MKRIILSLALLTAASAPVSAHHETLYGLIWKAGYSAPKQGSPTPNEVWRYAFVSKYTWNGCHSSLGY